MLFRSFFEHIHKMPVVVAMLVEVYLIERGVESPDVFNHHSRGAVNLVAYVGIDVEQSFERIVGISYDFAEFGALLVDAVTHSLGEQGEFVGEEFVEGTLGDATKAGDVVHSCRRHPYLCGLLNCNSNNSFL